MHLPPFQHLIDAHWREVARLAWALAGPVDGDDVAQQAWLQAYAAYPRLTSAANLRGWLLTITHRCAMDRHRARARHPVPVPDEALLGPTLLGTGLLGANAVAPHTELPDAELPDTELWSRVAALPERQRQAVTLRFVGDLDHATIAAMLDTTPTMSRRLVSDALAALRRNIP